MFLEIIYLMYMYKKDLALNNLQRLIHHKTKLNQTKLQLTLLSVEFVQLFACSQQFLNVAINQGFDF